MSEDNSWADQWFKAQQQFVDAWSDMAKTGSSGNASQSDLWAHSFDLWRKACEGKTQPDMELAMRKCMDMGKEYFAMAAARVSAREPILSRRSTNGWSR
jgi:hypothetical protein